MLAGIRHKHASPPVQKETIPPVDILTMVATLGFDLRGLRDRAILQLGYAGGLRRSEIVGLEVGNDDAPDTGDWVETFDDGAQLSLDAKTGRRLVEIARVSSDQTCPKRSAWRCCPAIARASVSPVPPRSMSASSRDIWDTPRPRRPAATSAAATGSA